MELDDLAAGGTAVSISVRNEYTLWTAAEKSGSSQQYKNYLQEFPDGVCSDLGQKRVQEALAWEAVRNSANPLTFESFLLTTLPTRFAESALDRLIATAKASRAKDIYENKARIQGIKDLLPLIEECDVADLESGGQVIAADTDHSEEALADEERPVLGERARNFTVDTSEQANLFIEDLRFFVEDRPGEIAPRALAELFAPALQEIGDGKFAEDGSSFGKLLALAWKNRVFRSYRDRVQSRRADELKKLKDVALGKISEGVALLESRILADPLDPNAFAFTQLIEMYGEFSRAEPLQRLERLVEDLIVAMREVGVEPTFSGGSTVSINSAGGDPSKSKRSILELGDLLDGDVVVFAHVSKTAPSAYKDLDGNVQFAEPEVKICAPTFESWTHREQYFFNVNFRESYPHKQLVLFSSCEKDLAGYDLLVIKGVDLARSRKIPSEAVLAESFRNGSVTHLLTITKLSLNDELRRREILSEQYAIDIIEETRLGYGAVAVDGKSAVGCIVVPDNRLAHVRTIDDAVEARKFQFGTDIREFVDVDVPNAFLQLQKDGCGLVYAREDGLKKIIEGAQKIDLAFTVLPVWISSSQIVQEIAHLEIQANEAQQSEADRVADLERRREEEELRQEREAAALSVRQTELRNLHGAKVASLVSRIEQEIKQIRDSIELSLDAMNTAAESTAGMDFWEPIPMWYAKKIQSGWEFDSATSSVKDYGIAVWKDRHIEAVIARVHILMKNRSIGEYSDDCWYAGYLVDMEFAMQREPFVGECSNPGWLRDWQVNHRFDTRWDLGVK